ncbi:AAC(3) family N-acetyltransferase [Evansella sp. AB-P1]|uniref:AAC(3) family N-acetyltransferase n=1 Tax=Evansella sp. AB-P1 TaxID=3037653 RepID=UPI00241F0E93|nr:AAC(3) family N-acetyltransferase [Evansella sp. AB-P1]MDG5786179.1 AAC(3) family N-acetyltransferase [Evansella sp. AB-P1]
MYTKTTLMNHLKELGIDSTGTVLVHSSMKSIGEVDGGGETVIDAFIDYMKEGLIVFPTHTWSYINGDNPKYYVDESPSCIGILPDLFRKREGAIRSLHPTHSVAAIGKDALSFISGDEKFDTPCARGSAWGKLLDRKAQIVLVGVSLIRNTFIHGIEEWVDIQGRLTDTHEQLYTVLPDGTEISVPSRRHCGLSWSLHFWKVEEMLLKHGAMHIGHFGDAEVRVCDTVKTTEILTKMLEVNPDLFSDNEPLDNELYKHLNF